MRWQGRPAETVEQFWDRVTRWHEAFAWLPVKTADGEWLWWESYWRKGRVELEPGQTEYCRLDIRWEVRRAEDVARNADGDR